MQSEHNLQWKVQAQYYCPLSDKIAITTTESLVTGNRMQLLRWPSKITPIPSGHVTLSCRQDACAHSPVSLAIRTSPGLLFRKETIYLPTIRSVPEAHQQKIENSWASCSETGSTSVRRTCCMSLPKLVTHEKCWLAPWEVQYRKTVQAEYILHTITTRLGKSPAKVKNAQPAMLLALTN